MVGLPPNKNRKMSSKWCGDGVNIIHHYTEDTLVSVTGCHHRQTDPQNLWEEKRTQLLHWSYITTKQWTTGSISNVSERQAFSHKASFQVGGLEGRRVIKVKGSGTAEAVESAAFVRSEVSRRTVWTCMGICATSPVSAGSFTFNSQ